MQEAQRCLTSLVFNPTTESQTPLPNPNALQDASESVQRLRKQRSSSQSNVPYQISDTAPQLPPFTHSPPSSPALTQSGGPQAPPTETGLQPPNVRRQSQQQPSPTPYGGGTFEDDAGSGLAYLGSSISLGSPSPALPAGAGPSSTFDAANGRSRHGARSDKNSMQYDYQEDRSWARNQAASSPQTTTEAREGPHAEEVDVVRHLPPAPSRTYSQPRPDPPKKRASQDSYRSPQVAAGSSSSAAAAPADSGRPQLPKLPSHMAEFRRSSMDLSQPAPPQPPAASSSLPNSLTAGSSSGPAATSSAAGPQSSAVNAKPSGPVRKLSSPPTSPQGQSIPVLPSAHDFYNARVSANEALQNSLPTAPPRVAPVVTIPGRNSTTSPDLASPTSASGPSRPPKTRLDASKLGSKHGFDDPAYRGETDNSKDTKQPSNFPQIRPSTRDNTGPPSGYTYHPPGQAYSLPASAFSGGRRGQAAPASSAGPSPAMLIQQEYMRKEREALERAKAEERERAAAEEAAAAAAKAAEAEAEAQAQAQAQVQTEAYQQHPSPPYEAPQSMEQPQPSQHRRDDSETSSVAPLNLRRRSEECVVLPFHSLFELI